MDNKQLEHFGPIKAILILYKQGKITKYIPIYQYHWNMITKGKLEKHLIVKNMLLNEHVDCISLRLANEEPNGINWMVGHTVLEIHADESIKQLRADYGSIDRSADWWAARYLKNEEIKQGQMKFPKATEKEIEAFNQWAKQKREQLDELSGKSNNTVNLDNLAKKI